MLGGDDDLVGERKRRIQTLQHEREEEILRREISLLRGYLIIIENDINFSDGAMSYAGSSGRPDGGDAASMNGIQFYWCAFFTKPEVEAISCKLCRLKTIRY